MATPVIPFNDLSVRYAAYAAELGAAAQRVIDSGWVVMGRELSAFESAFADYVGAPHCIGVASGTDALELGLRSVGVGAGDRVALVANAAMYGYTALQAIGAKPAFMDVDAGSHCATAAGVERALDEGVRAVLVTHLYGQLCPDIEAIAALCDARGVALFEDCAQAHGARRDGRNAGTFGAAASFSFYPTKNLGAIGDGGAVVCRDDDTADTLRALRQYGWSEKYTVTRAHGRNSRLDEMQAAFLSIFLPQLDADNAARRTVARRYTAGIGHPRIITPPIGREDHVAHLYVVQCDDRAGLREHLRAHGVATDIHYPVPDHHQPILRERYGSVSLPVTERLCDTVLSLPCFPGLRDDQVDAVIDAVNGWAA